METESSNNCVWCCLMHSSHLRMLDIWCTLCVLLLVGILAWETLRYVWSPSRTNTRGVSSPCPLENMKQRWDLICSIVISSLLLWQAHQALPIWGGGSGGEMPQSDKEFHQAVTILEHIWYDDGVTKVLLPFCCPLWTGEKQMFSSFLFTFTVGTCWGHNRSNESLVWDCGCWTLIGELLCVCWLYEYERDG